MASRCHKTIRQHPLSGVLDAHTPIGNAPSTDFRVVLNTEMIEQSKLARRPGWQGLLKDEPGNRGNRDLHDQLRDLDSDPDTHQKEAISFLAQVQSDCRKLQFVAGTKSRLYTDTGSSANWRIIADQKGPQGTSPQSQAKFSSIRWSMAQLGNYALFTNDYDPVLAWKIGDGITKPVNDPATPEDETEETCRTYQAALPVLQIREIGILRAGVIAAWSGFVFLGDVETDFGRECDTVYWSDFNSPLDWVPEGESASGFVSLGRGERVMRMEPMAGQLRVYTNQAVYNVTLVGGDEVFRFTEIYRGPDFLAYRFALANLGSSHVYLCNQGIVELGLYDPTPNRVDWVHKAGGVITRGLDGRLLRDYPGDFTGFGPLDRDRCNQVTAFYNRCRREVWFSWPTIDSDSSDKEGVKRMSLVLSRLYRHASLVDHGFSAFTNFVPNVWTSVKDWMVDIGACTVAEINEKFPPFCKEGENFNTPNDMEDPPEFLFNSNETIDDPDTPEIEGEPIDQENSVCGLYGDDDVIAKCTPCEDPCRFAMASLRDFTIKEEREELRLREVYVGT